MAKKTTEINKVVKNTKVSNAEEPVKKELTKAVSGNKKVDTKKVVKPTAKLTKKVDTKADSVKSTLKKGKEELSVSNEFALTPKEIKTLPKKYPKEQDNIIITKITCFVLSPCLILLGTLTKASIKLID